MLGTISCVKLVGTSACQVPIDLRESPGKTPEVRVSERSKRTFCEDVRLFKEFAWWSCRGMLQRYM